MDGRVCLLTLAKQWVALRPAVLVPQLAVVLHPEAPLAAIHVEPDPLHPRLDGEGRPVHPSHPGRVVQPAADGPAVILVNGIVVVAVKADPSVGWIGRV